MEIVRSAATKRTGSANPMGATVPFYTDASVLQPHFAAPAVILGPGQPDQAHQTDEYCQVASIRDAEAIYRDVIARWCEAG